MASILKTEMIVKQIKSASNTKTALSIVADLLLVMEKARVEDAGKLKIRIVELRTAIAGNGDPSQSLLARMESAEKTQKELEEQNENINKLIQGDATEGSYEKSLLWMIGCNTKVAISTSRVTWAVVLTTIGILLVNIFG